MPFPLAGEITESVPPRPHPDDPDRIDKVAYAVVIVEAHLEGDLVQSQGVSQELADDLGLSSRNPSPTAKKRRTGQDCTW